MQNDVYSSLLSALGIGAQDPVPDATSGFAPIVEAYRLGKSHGIQDGLSNAIAPPPQAAPTPQASSMPPSAQDGNDDDDQDVDDATQAHSDLISHVLQNPPEEGEHPADYLSRIADNIQAMAEDRMPDDELTDAPDLEGQGSDPGVGANIPGIGVLAAGVPPPQTKTPSQASTPSPPNVNPKPVQKPLVVNGPAGHKIEIVYQTPDGKAPTGRPSLGARFANNAALHLGKGDTDCKGWLKQVGNMTGIQLPQGVSTLWLGQCAKDTKHYVQVPNDASQLQPGDLICTEASDGYDMGHVETVIRGRDRTTSKHGKPGRVGLYRVSASTGDNARPGAVRNRLPDSGPIGCSDPGRHSPMAIFRLVDPSEKSP